MHTRGVQQVLWQQATPLTKAQVLQLHSKCYPRVVWATCATPLRLARSGYPLKHSAEEAQLARQVLAAVSPALLVIPRVLGCQLASKRMFYSTLRPALIGIPR